MEDDYRDIGAIARSCNMNKPNNVIAPKLGLKASHVWNYFDRVLSPGMNIFNGSSESVSLDFPIARQERSYDQRIKHSTDVAYSIIGTKPPLEIGSKNKMLFAVVQNKGDGKEK
uniref:Uncharacterized protein n=1 Tax=Solanum lycopersicum TaxID=4081 RepID=A0A3Q7GLH2_SOLLC